jgi:NAD+ kinase
MRRIGLFYNPLSEQSVELSGALSQWLHAQGIEIWRGAAHEWREHPDECSDLDLLIALGGDGTVLRAARLAIMNGGVPVLPVALGRLNFMAELNPDELVAGLQILLGGGGWHDERTLLEASAYCNGVQLQRVLALNEVIVARSEINRVIGIEVELYNAKLTTYQADGVILATATGSTGYALSAGGPIIDPRSRAVVLVPIAAHLTNIPSLVLHEDAELILRLRGRYNAAFSADGREPVPLHPDDYVRIRRAPEICVFARVHPPHSFYSRLAQRLRRDD